MKSFIAHCKFHGTILTIAMLLARWTCWQPIEIVDDDGDRRISSDDFYPKSNLVAPIAPME